MSLGNGKSLKPVTWIAVMFFKLELIWNEEVIPSLRIFRTFHFMPTSKKNANTAEEVFNTSGIKGTHDLRHSQSS